MSEESMPHFTDLNLGEPLLRVLKEVGYESPTPIQAATIPMLLANRDVLGQAQTGTGKTAAFALPILSRLVLAQTQPQALILVPTRELAIQVAEAFQRYATHIPGFHVLPIYGGQSYGPQLGALRRGVHVVVGTPGRVLDHLGKQSLDLSQVKTLVLDEADEMLRMGFIDDVESILKKTPQSRQTALFSATLPAAIKRIAQTSLRDPAEVTIEARTRTADNIRQRYWLVSGLHKLDALTRILEAESFDGMIVFTRTKIGTEELAERLQARGFSAAAINGDIVQAQRERTIQQLKDGKFDILVATDVAARGLDVDRISHVVNFDVPTDPGSYVHRIGRTGRAGRSGEAILFITPREKSLLRAIERATRQPIAAMELPTVEAVTHVRITKFKNEIAETLAAGELGELQSVIEDFEREMNIPVIEIAAALAKMARGKVPLHLDRPQRDERSGRRPAQGSDQRSDRRPDHQSDHRPDRARRPADDTPARAGRDPRPERKPWVERGERPAVAHHERKLRRTETAMGAYRIEVGYEHGVKPGNIVAAIASEARLVAQDIGRIEIHEKYTVLDLPERLPQATLDHLQAVQVMRRALRIRRAGDAPERPAGTLSRGKPFAPRHDGVTRGAGDRPPAKARPPSGDRPTRPGKPRGKPHRKGAKPGSPGSRNRAERS